MIAVPKIVLLALVAFVVWYALRWYNRAPPKAARRGPVRASQTVGGQAAGGQAAVEDLIACRACGAYVAATARGCGRAGCPRAA